MTFMKVISIIGRNMVSGSILSKMELFMKETLLMVFQMVKERDITQVHFKVITQWETLSDGN